MPKKKKVVLFKPEYIVPEFRGKKGKFIGCCPKCNLVLADWEIVDKTKAMCTRCETTTPIKKLKAYDSINDEFGL